MEKTGTPQQIPFFRADIGSEEIESVIETLKSGWLTSGPKVKQFESDFSDFVGAKYAIAVNSATAGLHLALEANQIGPGDEVLVPTITFAATAEVVIHLGATPILVDCDPATFNICLDDMKRKVTSNTRAIMPVHYAGQPCPMDEISSFAKDKNLVVIEDSAHAFPASYKGRTIGSLSPATCFSFYANKTITTGEGGMITTDDETLANRMRQMSLHGLSRSAWNRFGAKGSWYYEIEAPGYKYNLSDVAAAIGIGQLKRAQEFLDGRQAAALRYRAAFEDSPWLEVLDLTPNVEHSWHLFVIKLKLDKLTIDRSDFIVQLNEAGIGTSVHYTPLHLHPLYRSRYGYTPESMPNATSVFERIISLPIFASITSEQVDYVVAEVNRIAAENAA